ncbi:MAG: peroxiredoxin [Saprospiraceae bacterium]|jgi:peroxiredoxin Q/BCP|nr:peroxiredoxin [Saprospiraceae bacterium]
MSIDKKGNVKVGDAVPAFAAVNEKGEKVTPDTLKGHKNIIFFYGQDDSPTCTKEACNLRDNFKTFDSKGYRIYGVSKDNEKKHQKFINKYDLPYSLIADTELSMMGAFGYYGPKIFMGKEVNGVYRTTVVTDAKGIITHIIEDVVSGDHSNQLKTALSI